MITAIVYSQNSQIKLTLFAEGVLFTLCHYVIGRSVKKQSFFKNLYICLFTVVVFET